MRVIDRMRGLAGPASLSPGREIRRHPRGPARLEGVMAPSNRPLSPRHAGTEDGEDGRWRRVRAPWHSGEWTPEEVARALHMRREELLGELRRLPTTRGLPESALEEIVDDAACAVVMKRRAIVDEEHLRRAFWLSVKLLLARYREGRHRVRLGSRERTDFDAVAMSAPVPGPGVSETVELLDRLALAADFMAQLDEFEARVTALMAIRGVGIKLAARELGVPLKTVKAAAQRAEAKLEQVATIAAAGRMCGYREGAIRAHASGTARSEQAKVARAHLAACAGCRRSYVLMVREMRRREFQRRASAALLPMPLLPVGAHPGLAERLAAFVNARVPGGGVPAGGSAPRERVLTLLGGGAGAAKSAGVLAGATLLVVGATSGVRELTGSHTPARHRAPHIVTNARPTSEAGASMTTVASGAARGSEPTRSVKVAQTTDGRSGGGFSYLGGSPSGGARRPDPPPPSDEAGTGRAASLNYLGGNAPRSSTGAAPAPATATASSASAESTSSRGGQFSP